MYSNNNKKILFKLLHIFIYRIIGSQRFDLDLVLEIWLSTRPNRVISFSPVFLVQILATLPRTT